MKPWAAAAALAIASCGGHAAPEPPVEPPAISAQPHEAAIAESPPESIAMPRPDPQPPADVDTVARWPLGFNEHPEDEPSFDIAGALADPGVTWRQLCARGAQFGHRATDQDLVAYLKSWCTEDIDDAVYQLGLLQSSTIHGVASAVASDAARRLVHVAADVAEGTLMRAHLDSLRVFDVLAASYLEVGELDDALAMNTVALHGGGGPDDAATCHRLARGVVIARGDVQASLAKLLHRLAVPYQPAAIGAHVIAADATCVALDEDIGCWINPEACVGDTKLETRSLQLAIAEWPGYATTFSGWNAEYEAARSALPRPYGARLTVSALHAELLTSACDDKRLAELIASITVLRRDFALDPELERELDEIVATAKLPTRRCITALARR